LGEATFAGIGGKEEDAPIPAVRGNVVELVKSTLNRPSTFALETARLAARLGRFLRAF
jgi:hypothetical protein